jgi:hypothetical protein
VTTKKAVAERDTSNDLNLIGSNVSAFHAGVEAQFDYRSPTRHYTDRCCLD